MLSKDDIVLVGRINKNKMMQKETVNRMVKNLDEDMSYKPKVPISEKI